MIWISIARVWCTWRKKRGSMKHPFYKSLVAAGALALVGLVACGDDNPSNPGDGILSSSSAPISGPIGGLSSGSVIVSSSAVAGSSGAVAGSSGSVVPGSSGSTQPGVEPVSSSSQKVELDASGFPTIESYGAPSPEYTKDISSTAKRGWNTRYWDACKPHCSWLRENENDVTRADTSSNEAYGCRPHDRP